MDLYVAFCTQADFRTAEIVKIQLNKRTGGEITADRDRRCRRLSDPISLLVWLDVVE